MCDINGADVQTCERNATTITKDAKCTAGEPSLKFLQLVSIFESDESATKQQPLSQRRLTVEEEDADESEAGASLAPTDEVDSSAAAAGKTAVSRALASSASGVAVTNYVDGASWTERPKRNLLVVIHPWCMLRKSGPDRQSEFPPPGFLERLKAKLLALHCDTDGMQPTTAVAGVNTANKRRRNNNQKINYWIRYMSAITSPVARPCVKTVKTSAVAVRQKEPTSVACVDFLEVRRRFASIAAEFESGGWPRQNITPLQ